MSNIDWSTLPIADIIKYKGNRFVLRTKKIVANTEPIVEKIFSDNLLSLFGHYNKKGIVIGYEIIFKENPTIMLENSYLLLSYVKKEKMPKDMSYPKLNSKKDSNISLVKFGKNKNNRMYVFIYRKK